MHILRSIHTACHRYFCILTRAVQSAICVYPCGCSQLEPQCIHENIHKHHFGMHLSYHILLYMNPCCANSQMSVPLRVLTLRIFCISPCAHKYTYHITDMFVHTPCCANSHMFVRPSGRSHLEPLCIHAYIHKYTYYIYHIKDIFLGI